MDVTIINPIICALDTGEVENAHALAAGLAGRVGAVKLGLEFFTANGAVGVQRVSENGLPIFLDLKFHDIPNTVYGAVRATAGIRCFMMTVQASGGKAMMQAAIDASMEVAHITGQARPLIVGVTVLTSMDERDIESIGVQGAISDQVKRLAALAQESALDGVVCSPHELEMLRAQCGEEFKLVVPGIRPTGSAKGDQKRVMTPAEALGKGADWLVIGRPITEAPNPAEAAAAIAASLKTLI